MLKNSEELIEKVVDEKSTDQNCKSLNTDLDEIRKKERPAKKYPPSQSSCPEDEVGFADDLYGYYAIEQVTDSY